VARATSLMACGAKRLAQLVCLGNPDRVDSRFTREPNQTFPPRQQQQRGRPTWQATAPEEDWPEELDRSEVHEIREEPWGDRRQELVIIGARIADELLDQLEQCCLADVEMAVIREGLARPSRPFSRLAVHQRRRRRNARTAAAGRSASGSAAGTVLNDFFDKLSAEHVF
jgi:hypothetical protein